MRTAGPGRLRCLAVGVAALVGVGGCGGDGDEKEATPAAAPREATTTAPTTSSSTSSPATTSAPA
ncbi:MAG: hypothetical protein M3N68_06520, partial [Actinomycetota bacterium]|nr:hypothetical protein [Actinomycetota bacterium]